MSSPFLPDALALSDSPAARALVRALSQPPPIATALLCPLAFTSETHAVAVPALADATANLRAIAWRSVEKNRIARWLVGETFAWMEPWNALRPQDVRNLDVIHACAATKHDRGYVREAAVRRLAEIHHVHVLPWLIVRLNDWVVPVRVAAGQALSSWISGKHHATWARLLPLVQSLADSARTQHRDFIARIEGVLLDNIDGLVGHIRENRRDSRARTPRRCRPPPRGQR